MAPRVLRPERSYADRIELLRLLQERYPYPAGWDDQRAGIRVQTEWQERSGRAIAAADGRLTTWWPMANWTLTVWQLEALQRRGDREVADVALAERLVPLPDDVAASIVAYYDALAAVRAGGGAGDKRRHLHVLQQRLWDFHVRAIERGLAASAALLDELPFAERRFAEAWGYGVVALLAAANIPTPSRAVGGLQALLPPRLVVDDDWEADAPSDFSRPQRDAILAMRALHEAEAIGAGFAARLAFIAATPDGARVAGKALSEALFFGGAGAVDVLSARLRG